MSKSSVAAIIASAAVMMGAETAGAVSNAPTGSIFYVAHAVNSVTVTWRIAEYGNGATSADVYLDYGLASDFSDAATVTMATGVTAAAPTTGSYTLSGLTTKTTYCLRMRVKNNVGLETATVPDSAYTSATTTYTWSGGGVANKWDDPANWGSVGGYPRAGDTAAFGSGVTVDTVMDNDSHVKITLAKISVGNAHASIKIPQGENYPFTNTVDEINVNNSVQSGAGFLILDGDSDGNGRLSIGAKVYVGNATSRYNNTLVLKDVYCGTAGFVLGDASNTSSNNWLVCSNSVFSISNIQWARGEYNGIIVAGEKGSSYANMRVGVGNGAKVYVLPGATAGGGGQSSFQIDYGGQTGRGEFHATNATLNASSWAFQGTASTATVMGCSGCLFSQGGCNGGSQSSLRVADSRSTQSAIIGGVGVVNVSGSAITNSVTTITAMEVNITNTVMYSSSGNGAGVFWRMQNTSGTRVSRVNFDAGQIQSLNYGGVGYEWGSGSYRNNLLYLRFGSQFACPNLRIAGGGQNQNYSGACGLTTTNNWLYVESGSRVGGTLGTDGSRVNGRTSLGLGGSYNGLVVTGEGSEAWFGGTVYSNCTVRAEKGGALNMDATTFTHASLEFAGDARGNTVFASGTTVTFAKDSVLVFEPDTTAFQAVPFAKINAAAGTQISLDAKKIARCGGSKHLTLATYTQTGSTANFTLSPDSKPSGIEVHAADGEIWAKVIGHGFQIIIR